LLLNNPEEHSSDAQVSGKGLNNRFYGRQEGHMQMTHKENLCTINDRVKSPPKDVISMTSIADGHVCIISTKCSTAALNACMTTLYADKA